jgi:MSHA biogenesis protein MshG
VAEFAYKGRSTAGHLVSGRITSASSEAVANRLISNGVTPLEIKPASESRGMTVGELWRRLGGGRPTTRDLCLFCRQMHVIARTGLPLLQGLGGLAETTHNVVLRETLQEVIASLESGRNLSQSLARHPDIFPALFVSVIEVGEATGTMDVAFERMYDHLSLDQQIRDRVASAIRYPIIVLIGIAIALAIITVFVIPNFAPIFRALGDNIPMPTRIIMGVSGFAINHWHIALGMLVALGASIVAYGKAERGRFNWDRLKLRLPVTGVIVRNAVLSRITRSLAISLEAGLPMNETLQVVSGAIGNTYLSEKMASISYGIEHGESLSRTARAAGLFTPLVLQMLALGEETGALPELLRESADHYKREVDYDLENLSAALEPILIVTVGVVVLVLALGVFLPMWDMVAAARA